jgi:hypothetical protein
MKLNRLLALAFAIFATLAQAEPGMLRITTSPGDAQIFVNGQRKGNSPSQEGQTFAVRLPQGDYTVEARKSDGNYYGKKSVYVANDSLQTVNISLEEVKQPAKPYGQSPNGSAKLGGLEWLRCSLGQAWSGGSCTGEAKAYTVEEAKTAVDAFNSTGYGGKRDWRVPTVRELQSLRVCSTGFASETTDIQDGGAPVSNDCRTTTTRPAIDTAQFPQTPRSFFRSSSSYLNDVSGVWDVLFETGLIGIHPRDMGMYVRLVRAGQ